MDILSIPFVTPYTYAKTFCGGIRSNPTYDWLLWGKLPEDVVVNPSADTQVISASGVNKYLQSVTINPIIPISGTVTLAAAATATYTIKDAVTVVSSTPAAATAAITNGVVTITGVAAGTSTVTVEDINGDLLATIVVTVA